VGAVFFVYKFTLLPTIPMLTRLKSLSIYQG
jgi:hypothetical protein